jgi:hypothetical protein
MREIWESGELLASEECLCHVELLLELLRIERGVSQNPSVRTKGNQNNIMDG